MSAAGFTPIQLYRTTTASAVPSAGNLAAGELAINLTDEALYFKNAAGVVTLLADSSGALGSVTSVNASGGTTGMTFSGGPITSSGTLTLGGTLAVANGGTGVTTSTGTGSVVLSNSPTLVTPTLGVASATSIATGKGTVGAVAYGFTTNTNTGMWSPSSDAIAFSTAGSERLRVDSSGRVGIGTDAPSDLLHVAGNIRAAGASPVIAIWNAAGSDRYGFLFGQSGSMTFAAEGASRPMLFSVAGSERMRITAAGDVGIGTSSVSPIFGTTVRAFNAGNGATLQLGGSTVNAYFFASEGLGRSTIGNSSAHPFTLITSDTERMRITPAGDVGIGTSSPGARLDVAGGDIYVRTGGRVLTDTVQGYSGLTTPLALGAAQTVTISTASTERMRIDSSGNLLVGTATTAYGTAGRGLIEVNGSSSALIAIKTGDTARGYFAASSTVTELSAVGASQPLLFTTGGAERMRIDSSGNVGIGTASPGQRLEVAGSIAVTGGGNIFSNSTASTWGIAGGNAFNNGGGITVGGSTSSVIAGGIYFSTGTGATNSERMRIDSSGNVGIGTSAPSQKLQVAASTNQLSLTTGTNELIARASSTEAALYTFQAIPLVFYNNNTERMRIDSSGNVGINETAPDYRLDVNGAIGFAPGASVTPVDNGDVVFELTSNNTLSIKARGSDGVVRVGTILLT